MKVVVCDREFVRVVDDEARQGDVGEGAVGDDDLLDFVRSDL